MPQIILDLTETQHQRVLDAYGVATAEEVASLLIAELKEKALAAENNKEIARASSKVAPW